MMTLFKNFKIVARSSNLNSFGLRGYVFLSEDGETWEAASASPEFKVGQFLQLTYDHDSGELSFARHGFEIPRRLKNAPQSVLDEVFKKYPQDIGAD